MIEVVRDGRIAAGLVGLTVHEASTGKLGFFFSHPPKSKAPEGHQSLLSHTQADSLYSTGSVENNWLRMPSGSAFLDFCWTTTPAKTADSGVDVVSGPLCPMNALSIRK